MMQVSLLNVVYFLSNQIVKFQQFSAESGCKANKLTQHKVDTGYAFYRIYWYQPISPVVNFTAAGEICNYRDR